MRLCSPGLGPESLTRAQVITIAPAQDGEITARSSFAAPQRHER
jgi:hypothetical protein